MGNEFKEISFTDIKGIRIGNAQDYEGMTGVTVMIFDEENTGGIDISGGGPACREPYLLNPLMAPQSLNAIVLSGGSAYGLDASAGVMKYLEEHDKGFHILGTVVPLVVQSCIFDLMTATPFVRPDAAMGYAACQDAEGNHPESGIIGAGTGACIGKICGMKRGQKSGIGYYAMQLGELQVGAVVVVNAFGDVYDYKNGQKIAGTMNAERTELIEAEELFYGAEPAQTRGNTTLAIVVTNADLSHAQMSKVASMARGAYSRCIKPVGTLIDGDTIYAMSVGDKKVEADINVVGTLAVRVLSEAILDAVRSSVMDNETFLEKALEL